MSRKYSLLFEGSVQIAHLLCCHTCIVSWTNTMLSHHLFSKKKKKKTGTAWLDSKASTKLEAAVGLLKQLDVVTATDTCLAAAAEIISFVGFSSHFSFWFLLFSSLFVSLFLFHSFDSHFMFFFLPFLPILVLQFCRFSSDLYVCGILPITHAVCSEGCSMTALSVAHLMCVIRTCATLAGARLAAHCRRLHQQRQRQ
jgi:hypothetical protein